MLLKDAKHGDLIKGRGYSLILTNREETDKSGFWSGEPAIKFIDANDPFYGACLRTYELGDECELITGTEKDVAMKNMLTKLTESYNEMGGYVDLVKDLQGKP